MDLFSGKSGGKQIQKANRNGGQKIKGRMVLMKKGMLDFHDMKASILDRVYELLGKRVHLQLISADHPDPGEMTLYFSNILIPKTCL